MNGSAMSGQTRPPALSMRGIDVAYGGTPVLREVSFDVPAGVLCSIIGPNGAGKSTAIKAALGLVTPSRGSVRILGEPLRSVRRR
ncbi:MAG: ATP-binding cassette domain-containing protein, partial [Pseudonocardiaceae bacterium]|nr:ATP-binding cassette domain-containing protein [Pseudonocardiaceae bacterium]